MKRLTLTLFAGLSTLFLPAQRILAPYQEDSMIHIFKLNAEQTRYLLQNSPFHDTAWLYSQPFKSIPRKQFKQEELPPGSYIKLHADFLKLVGEWFQVLPCRVQYAEFQNEIIWYVMNKNIPYEPLRNIQVKLNGQKLTYRSGTGGFTLSKSDVLHFSFKSNNQLAIQIGEDTYYLQTRTGFPAKKVLQDNKYIPGSRRHKVQSGGYLVSNQPVYRLGDSVKLKGFFCTPDKGKPFRGKVNIQLKEPKQNFDYKTSCKTISPGAILFNWKIPDTLKFDRTLKIRCWYDYKGLTCEMEKEVYLEDYRLNQTSLFASMAKTEFGPSDSVAFTVNTVDASGFALTGVKVKAKLFLNELYTLNADSFRYNTIQSRPVYILDTLTGSAMSTQFYLNDKYFPPVDGEYKLEVKIIDPSTQESKEFDFKFTKNDTRKSFQFAMRQDTLLVKPLLDGKPVRCKYTLLLCQQSDTVSRREIVTPYQGQLPSYITHVSLQDENGEWYHLETEFVPLQLFTVKGNKTADSVLILLQTPLKEHVHFRLYKGSRMIKEAEGRSFRWAASDPSTDPYTLEFTSGIGAKPWSHFYRLEIVPKKLELKIVSDLPASAQPGQEVAVQLKVKDFWNRPVKHANLTAWGVNALFSERLPDPVFSIPDPLKQRTTLTAVEPLHTEELVPEKEDFDVSVDSRNLDRVNLRRNPWYHIYYPDQGFEILRLKKHTSNPELAIVFTSGHHLYAPAVLECDGQLLQLAEQLSEDLMTISVQPGEHNILCRYLNSEIQFRMNTEPGYKYLVCIEDDSLQSGSKFFQYKQIRSLVRPDSAELEKMGQRYLLTNEFDFYSLNVDHLLNHSQGKYFKQAKPKVLNIRGERYYLFGPSEGNFIRLTRNGISQELRTGMKGFYVFHPKFKEFRFQPEDFNHQWFLSSFRKSVSITEFFEVLPTDTVLKQFEPDFLPNNNHQQFDSTLYFPQHKLSSSGFSEARIELRRTSSATKIMGLWVINDSLDEDCDFVHIQSDSNQFSLNKPLMGSRYSLYVLLKPDRYILIPDITLTPGDHLILNVDKFPTLSLRHQLPYQPITIYDRLTEPELRSLSHPPVKKELIIQHHTPFPGKPRLRGIISDEFLQAQSGVVVYAELAGEFLSGTLTNSMGRFELELPGTGTYQIKMHQTGGDMIYFHPKVFGDSTIYYLNLKLPKQYDAAPSLDISNEHIHFSAIKKEYEKKMWIKLFEKTSQAELKEYTVRLMYRGQTISEYRTSSSRIEIYFPSTEHVMWDVSIHKNGYHSLLIKNLIFYSGYQYQMQCYTEQTDLNHERTKEIQLDMTMLELTPQNSNCRIREISGYRGSEIYGRVVDEKNIPLDFASVRVSENGIIRGGAKTDMNGRYTIKPIQAGTYTLLVTFVGYQTQEIQNIVVRPDKRISIDIKLTKKTMQYSGVTIRNYKIKLIDASDPASRVMTRESIRSLPSISTGDFASFPIGVYQRKVGDRGISIGGDRSTSDVYMIDGLLIRSNVRQKQNKNEEHSLSDISNSMTEESPVRSEFSDEAFWVPNLITDKQGMAQFSFRLPDNLTTWKTYLLAMGKKWKHGMDTSMIHVYKPIQAASILPTFLYKQDQVFGRVKFTNHFGDTLNVKTRIKLNGNLAKSSTLQLIHAALDSVLLNTQKDTLFWTVGIETKNDFQDREQWKIPVLSSALEIHNSRSFVLSKDSTWIIEPEPGSEGILIFQDKLADRILEEIKELRKYKYGCVEQTSSKIRACILEIRILKLLHKPIPEELKIPVFIQRLKDLQNTSGSWGWWKSEEPNWRMTLYAMEQLWQADLAGYQNEVWIKAKDAVLRNFSELGVSDKVYALYLLAAMHAVDEKTKNYLDGLRRDELSSFDRLYYFLALQHSGQEVSSLEVQKLMAELLEQSSTSYRGNFFLDPTSAWFLSFDLIRNTNLKENWAHQAEIDLLNNEFGRFQNTFSKAAMIQALTEQLFREGKNTGNFRLFINDTLQINNLPYRMAIGNVPVKIKHTGKPIYMKLTTIKRELNPTHKDSLLSIQTQFFQNQKQNDTLELGVRTKLNVDVECRKGQTYVMIEIPLPSNMYLINKPEFQSKNGYAEYYRDRIVLFFQDLPRGFHTYDFELQPFLSGRSILPACKASLMYYPENNANNTNRMIVVR